MLSRNILIATLSCVFWVANAVENPWGTYYKIAGTQFNDKKSLFTTAWDRYLADPNKKTTCDKPDFRRWYESSQNSDHLILSYFCQTSGLYSFEHLKVSESEKKVIEFQASLKGFGIPDAGEYSALRSLEGEIAEAEQILKLRAVNDTVAEQVDDIGKFLCPNPDHQTLYKVQRKTENGLNYYKFPISCNVTSPNSHMTHIEVVDDLTGKWKEGNSVLASMEVPQRNTEFLEKKKKEEEERIKAEEEKAKEEAEKAKEEEEKESGMQKDGTAIAGWSLASLVLVPVVCLLK